MNKTFFAKYLIAKGDVKEGDKVLNIDENIVELVGHNGTLDLNTVQEEPDVFPKVELFICSRDLRVGNEVFHLPDTNPKIRFKIITIIYDCAIIEYIEHPNEKIIGKQREWLLVHLFKVIGKLSSGAIWVNEYDEFDVSQLIQQGSGANITTDGGFVKILCSNCKTFH